MKKNPAAVALGKKSAKARRKKYKDFSEHMRQIRAGNKAKEKISTPNP